MVTKTDSEPVIVRLDAFPEKDLSDLVIVHQIIDILSNMRDEDGSPAGTRLDAIGDEPDAGSDDDRKVPHIAIFRAISRAGSD